MPKVDFLFIGTSHIVFVNVYDMVSNWISALSSWNVICWEKSLNQVCSRTLATHLASVNDTISHQCCYALSLTRFKRHLPFRRRGSWSRVLLWWSWIRKPHGCICCWTQDWTSRRVVQVRCLSMTLFMQPLISGLDNRFRWATLICLIKKLSKCFMQFPKILVGQLTISWQGNTYNAGLKRVIFYSHTYVLP